MRFAAVQLSAWLSLPLCFDVEWTQRTAAMNDQSNATSGHYTAMNDQSSSTSGQSRLISLTYHQSVRLYWQHRQAWSIWSEIGQDWQQMGHPNLEKKNYIYSLIRCQFRNPNGKSETFWDQISAHFDITFQYILAWRAKMYWNLRKSPGFVPFGANLPVCRVKAATKIRGSGFKVERIGQVWPSLNSRNTCLTTDHLNGRLP